MGSSSKKVLFIDLKNQKAEVKSFPDLKKYIGGVALGLRLYELYRDSKPVIFSVGPLNGFFPFASKTSVILSHQKVVEDIYLGGYLSTRIKYADLDSIVIFGKAPEETVLDLENESVTFKPGDTNVGSLGLPGKKSSFVLNDEGVFLDEYFTDPQGLLAKKLTNMRVKGLSITATKNFAIKNPTKYEELYKAILERTKELKVEKGFFPSCAGCPMGCEKSKTGEIGGNVLAHSLVACDFAENIFSDLGTVFSCLNVLGYDYTHEDIENLPVLVQNTLGSIA